MADAARWQRSGPAPNCRRSPGLLPCSAEAGVPRDRRTPSQRSRPHRRARPGWARAGSMSSRHRCSHMGRASDTTTSSPELPPGLRLGGFPPFCGLLGVDALGLVREMVLSCALVDLFLLGSPALGPQITP